MRVTHQFVSPIADEPSSTKVKPSNWNGDHTITVSADGIVLGRLHGAGTGPPQEIPFDISATEIDLSSYTGGLTIPHGTTVQRPGSPNNGELRWNVTNGRVEYYDGTTWQNVAPGDPTFTGALMWSFLDSRPPGWMYFLGSFGPSGSTANFADDTTINLYSLCWSLSPLLFPMTDGFPRSSDAPTDWAAKRAITCPDWRETVFAVAGNMNGSTNNNRLGMGANGGFTGLANLYTLAGEKAHVQVAGEVGAHGHTLTPPAINVTSGAGAGQTGNVGSLFQGPSNTDLNSPAGAGFNVVQPTIMLNLFCKL